MIKAKKSLGQNFLIDKSILEKIVSVVDIKEKNILEIGPGTGNLTSYILMNKPKKLIVIEKDNYWNRLPWQDDNKMGVVTGSNRFRYALDRGYTHIEGIICKNRGDWFPLWQSTFVRVK